MRTWIVAVFGLLLLSSCEWMLGGSAHQASIVSTNISLPKALSAPPYTVKDRLEQFGAFARPAWQQRLPEYPPAKLRLVAFKHEKQLELWVQRDGQWDYLHRYPILAASGGAGPKLKQGDHQVPEGFYRITSLNPNSRFHLSMRVDYPNEFDRLNAAKERRTDLGGDIYIHGDAVSVGCLAIGDRNITELWVLVADVKARGGAVDSLFLPGKPEHQALFTRQARKPWLPQLYRELYGELIRMGWQEPAN